MIESKLKNKRIVVTGGTGFLGKRIVNLLEEKNAKVIVPRRKNYDLTNLEQTENLYEDFNPDILIHSAALYGGLAINERIPADIYDYNMRMMLNVFRASINYYGEPKIEKLVTIGSACSYPGSLGRFMIEERMWDGPIDKSVRNYGTIKRLMETTGHVYRDQFGLHSINLQLATLYGEGDTFNPERSHVVAALIRKFVEAKMEKKPYVEIWGSPDSVREFMYVEDCAEGIVRALEIFDGVEEVSDQSKYTLNIGTGQPTTIDYLAKTIKEITEYSGDIIYNGKSSGVREKVLEVSRMKKILLWEPQTSLEEGLKKTIEWYIINKEEADKRF
ncbi:MAG: NAD-dependent epimerase/dehydratase family protein [Candidatus Pacearchaeota archaeon]